RVGLRASAAALGGSDTHLDRARSFRHGERLRVSISDNDLAALQASRDHVVDCIAASAANPEHGDPRFHLAKVGNVSHVCSTIARAEVAPKWRMQLRGVKAGKSPGDRR